MRCSANLLAVCAWALVSASAPAAKKDDKPKDDAARESKKDSGKKKKDSAKGEASGEAKTKGKSKGGKDAKEDDGRMQVPIVPGHDSLGLKIPYYGADGTLQMTFNIGVASRLDPDHMKMVDTSVETFKDDGTSEMSIDLPESVIDLNTRIITAQVKVTIKRSDFQLTGNSMEFNTETKQGKLGGGVRMLIYNLEAEEGAKTEVKIGE